MAIHDNGLTFFKLGCNSKDKSKFEISQKKIILVKKILAVAFDYRSEMLAVHFENENSVIKVFKIDDNYFKSQNVIFKIAINPKKMINSMISSESKLHPHFYNSSLEFQMMLYRKQFTYKFDLVSLYNEMFSLIINTDEFYLSLTNLQNGQCYTYRIPETGLVIR
jgi:hypothetical protein